jgi:hypothetical protein
MRVNGNWVERKRLMRFFRLGEENYLSRGCFPGSSITSDLFFNTMKTSWLTIVLLVFAASRTEGQVSQSGPSAIAGQGTVPAQDTPYAVVDRGANHRVWQRTTYETRPDGKQIPHIHKYTELATGLHYKKNGQWVESKEQIDILPNGTAAATQGQHQAYFPGDIYQGVVELVTPDGIHLQSRPLGLSYDDGNHTVLIAELKDSVGQLVAPNQVIYSDAFTDFKADLRYTYTKAGFEQDIVLWEQPPSPEAYGLDPQTTRLQVLTEFFDTPEPVKTQRAASRVGNLSDTTLSFGQMKMTQGKAFSIAASAQTRGVSVSKSWQHLDGRAFLVEELPVQKIEPQLEQLPVPANADTTMNSPNSAQHKVSVSRLLPPIHPIQTGTNTVQLAGADVRQKHGVVLDYTILNSSQTDFTFQGDTTYYVGWEYNLSGTTIFEGGTVIKFDSYPSQIDIDDNGSVACKTGPYRPAIFTSMNDDSVGEAIDGSSGSPYTLDCNIFLNINCPNIVLSNMRFSHVQCAVTGLYWDCNQNIDIWDCQFVDVDEAVEGNPNLGLHNVLINETQGDPSINIEDGNFLAENVTSDGYFLGGTSGGTQSRYNCLDTSPNGSGWVVYWDISPGNSGSVCPTVPYQTVGAGSYYLATNSPYRNMGTTNISPALLAELRQKTTYPPIVYTPAIISTDMTFSPQAPRDINCNPDLGYHYDPLDYAVSENLVTNATVTINPGTAIAVFGIGSWTCGFGLTSGAQLICHGLANNLNRIVEYSTVQEQGANAGWGMPYNALVSDAFGDATQIVINCSFTDWSVLAQDAPHLYCCFAQPLTLQNCQFHGGLLDLFTTVAMPNCLLERVGGVLWLFDGNIPVIRNNLFYGGTFDFYPGVTNAVVKDNLFDQTIIVEDLTGWGYDGGYNAFVTNYDRMLPTFSSDVILSNSPAYQVGPLGNYYLPTDSQLINAGNTNANLLGLYHFTTQTNQVKETNSIVDIGYHYVAVDQYGNPIDTDGDGIPDYLEDANGNGLYDAGDLGDWQTGGSVNGSSNGVLTFPNGLTLFIFEPKPTSNVP